MISVFDLALENACARCEAQPGERCVTVTGKRARYEHEARVGPIGRAFNAGFDEGIREAVAAPEWAARWAAGR